jgi:hypothetical protein
VHNTQPWRFPVTGRAIELYADASRQLMEDATVEGATRPSVAGLRMSG